MPLAMHASMASCNAVYATCSSLFNPVIAMPESMENSIGAGAGGGAVMVVVVGQLLQFFVLFVNFACPQLYVSMPEVHLCQFCIPMLPQHLNMGAPVLQQPTCHHCLIDDASDHRMWGPTQEGCTSYKAA